MSEDFEHEEWRTRWGIRLINGDTYHGFMSERRFNDGWILLDDPKLELDAKVTAEYKEKNERIIDTGRFQNYMLINRDQIQFMIPYKHDEDNSNEN